MICNAIGATQDTRREKEPPRERQSPFAGIADEAFVFESDPEVSAMISEITRLTDIENAAFGASDGEVGAMVTRLLSRKRCSLALKPSMPYGPKPAG